MFNENDDTLLFILPPMSLFSFFLNSFFKESHPMTMFVSLSLCTGEKDLGFHRLPLLKSQCLSLYLKAEPVFLCFTSLVPQRRHQFLIAFLKTLVS